MKLRNRETHLRGKLTNIAFNINESEKEIDLTILLDNSDGECIDRQFYSLAELKSFLRDWEEYEPEEPLIKDEKIRKAVRAWYKLFDESQLGQFKDGKYIAVGFREFVLQSLDKSLAYTFELPFVDEMQSLKRRWGLDTDYYTITELCGEEEE